MKVLVADDEPVTRLVLGRLFSGWGYEPIVVGDGLAALDVLLAPDAPPLAVLDWMMPGLSGPEVCRLVRQAAGPPKYLILLTSREDSAAVVTGLTAGANDFVRKPFDEQELRARVSVASRVVAAERQLAERVTELEAALKEVRRLKELLPMCAWCKSIRNDSNYWQRVEDYLAETTGTKFTHGICPSCIDKMREEFGSGDSVTPDR